jgi:hypothetical protein
MNPEAGKVYTNMKEYQEVENEVIDNENEEGQLMV